MKKNVLTKVSVFLVICLFFIQLQDINAQQSINGHKGLTPQNVNDNYGSFIPTTSTAVGLFMEPANYTKAARLMIQKGWGDWIQFYSQNNLHKWAFHNPSQEDRFIIYHIDLVTNKYISIINFNSKGQVGIGTACHQEDSKLSVEGKIYAREIEVQVDSWCDFVFNDDYKLMSLFELEEFINNNNHLPDVPSENEVIAEGINLGEMDALLLKKIEELTLYVIELKKEVEILKTKENILH